MRFQVPQFTDIEDKLVGPLTLKQFLIYLSTVMALIPVYLVTDLSLFLVIAVPVLGVAALFAHFSLNGKSLFSVATSAISFFMKGQLFIWHRTGQENHIKLDVSEFSTQRYEHAGLSAKARALETAGNIVKSHDPEETPQD